jgi:hypothetical protein
MDAYPDPGIQRLGDATGRSIFAETGPGESGVEVAARQMEVGAALG